MAKIDIDWKNFVSGESTADYMPDRGFSPLSRSINLTKQRGILNFAPSATERGTSVLTGNIVCASPDPGYLGNDVYFLDDEGAFYTFVSTTLTKKQTSSGYTYQIGTSDLLPFLGNIYATSQTAVAQLTNNFAALTEDWWAGLTTGYRHPLERVESEMFIADKNVIYYWNGTSSGTAFTLPTDVNVTSLRKHTDGRTLLAFAGVTADYSHTENAGGRVFYCDPTIRDWTREVELEAQVEGTRVVGGVIYCTWGKSFGYFDGNGLNLLKPLLTSGTTYSHQMTNMEEQLIVRDGTNVLAFGNVGSGNIWRSVYEASQVVNSLAYKGDNKLLVLHTDGAGAGNIKELDFDDAGSNGIFYSNRIDFGEEVVIDRIEILHELTEAAGVTRFLIYEHDLNDNLNTIHDASYTNESVSKTEFNTNIKTDTFQLAISLLNDTIGFKRIRIYYHGT